MEVLHDNQLIWRNLLSSFDLILLYTFLFFMHLNSFWKFLSVSWRNIQLWYHWIDEPWRWLSVCMRYPLHGLHHNMCEGSWSIPYFYWFIHLLLWSRIYENFIQFYEFYFLITLWVHADGVWDIPFHVLEQERQVLLVHSCIHWVAWWVIEYHRELGLWYAWVHQPSDLGILHVFSQFASVIIQWEVYPWRVFV